MKGRLLLLAVLALAHLGLGSAKLVKGKALLNAEDCEVYVAKFAFTHNGHGSIKGKFWSSKKDDYFASGAHSLKVHLFPDELWGKYQEMLRKGSLCADRVGVAAYSTGTLGESHLEFEHIIAKSDLLDRSYYWYVLIADCALEFYPAKPPPLHYEITFMNGGGHLPADEEGLVPFFIVVWFEMLAVGSVLCIQAVNQVKQRGTLHLIVFILGLAYACQHQSIATEMLHMLVYSHNGKGLRWRHSWLPLDFISDLLQSASEFFVSFLLIALSLGWTLVESVPMAPSSFLASARKPIEMLTRPSRSTLFILSIVGAQLLLEAWGRRYKDDFNQFHDYEHLPGMLLVGLRLGMGAIFAFGLRSTIKLQPEARVHAFLKRLGVLGTAYFLAFPSLVACMAFVSPLNRHRFVAIGSLLIQSQTLLLMGWQFMRDESEYSKISSIAKMGTSFSETKSFAGSKLAVD